MKYFKGPACSHRGTTSKLQWPMQFMMSKKVKYIGINDVEKQPHHAGTRNGKEKFAK